MKRKIKQSVICYAKKKISVNLKTKSANLTSLIKIPELISFDIQKVLFLVVMSPI